MKRCCYCKEELPPDAFYAKHSACKTCAKARAIAWAKANPERVKATKAKYRASEHGSVKLREENKKRYAERKTDPAYMEAIREKSQKWREENRERHRAYSRQWTAEHPDRARARSAAHYQANKERSLELSRQWRANNRERARKIGREDAHRRKLGRDDEAYAYSLILRNDPCSYCGGPGGHVDHIIPLILGGSNDWTNLTAACLRCNSSKHAQALLLFLLRRWQATTKRGLHALSAS